MTIPSLPITCLPGQVAATIRFRSATALNWCTTIDGDGEGRVTVTRNWPRLSAGEERLWDVLSWLNGCPDLPTTGDLRAYLDEPNRAAVAALFAAEGRTDLAAELEREVA